MNMSYCRFRNTLNDLRDCVDAFDGLKFGDDEERDLSIEERRAMKNMIEIAEDYIGEAKDFLEGENE